MSYQIMKLFQAGTIYKMEMIGHNHILVVELEINPQLIYILQATVCLIIKFLEIKMIFL